MKVGASGVSIVSARCLAAKHAPAVVAVLKSPLSAAASSLFDHSAASATDVQTRQRAERETIVFAAERDGKLESVWRR
eukprot:6186117-Pleurochrysis_carterae.AAC.2